MLSIGLAEGSPIIWFRDQRYYNFAEGGVFDFPVAASAQDYATPSSVIMNPRTRAGATQAQPSCLSSSSSV
jgi:hypothetical protein